MQESRSPNQLGRDSEIDSTTADVHQSPRGSLGRWLSRAGHIALGVVLVAAAVGWLGPRDGTTADTADGWELQVTYPRVTRAGEPATLRFEVSRQGGFAGPITASLCGDWFDEMDFQNWYPNPADETRVGDRVLYEFDPPPDDPLVVALDARAAPGYFASVSDCELAIVDGGTTAAGVEFTTWRMP